ncbi:MAG: FeoA family protein [Bacteroidota bacterium]
MINSSYSKSAKVPSKLSQFSIGEKGCISEIQSKELEICLLKLGVCKGDTCLLSNKAPLGDPLAIVVNGTKISIRREDAARIRMQAI